MTLVSNEHVNEQNRFPQICEEERGNAFKRKFREKLLETFKFTIQFLDSHNLRWFAGSGTAIGAVRHKGMIPWDDDVDLLMPREDYNRLISIRKELYSTDYRFISVETDGKYYLPFAKIYDANTSLWEWEQIPCVIGVYVDIFPMELSNAGTDALYDAKYQEYFRKLQQYQYSVSQYSLKKMFSLWRQGKGAEAKDQLRFFAYNLGRSYFHRQFARANQLFACKDGSCYVSTGSRNGRKQIYDKAWFDDYKMVPFEDFEVRVASGNHEYLSLLYGDYMQLPPENQRECHDQIRYYCNLCEGLSLRQVKKRIKDGEHLVF